VATEDQIRVTEHRLGLPLPASYRCHLLSETVLPGDHGLTLVTALAAAE
jgi:hypothetical protein